MKKEILQTLSYADVFDYPLSVEEVWRFLISQRKTKEKDVQEALLQMSADSELIDFDNKYFFLKGRKKIVAVRKKRERWSQEKQKLAEKIAVILRKIPWVKMVGITGALAMRNSDKEDDIDLLIVTAKNRLWLTRLWVVFLSELVAKRRKPGDKNIKDKICLNMFLDEEHLEIPKKEQDLFSAHEVCQMRVLWDRDDTYQKFLWENCWVRKYLPNSIDTKILGYSDTKKQRKNLLSILISQSLNIIENIAYRIQLRYMKSRKTSEITEPGRIRFHPKDARVWVLKEYQKHLISE